MWTSEIVKARFVEAAEIERRMFVKGMTNGGNAWPTYNFDEDDRRGWVKADLEAELEWWSRNNRTTTPEITRWEETFFFWTPMIQERRRSLVWRFAQCRATHQSFSKYCETYGLVRMTAYNRLDRVFENLASRFVLEGRLMRLPKEMDTLQESDLVACTDHKMEVVAPKRGPTIHPPFRTEKTSR